MKFVSIFLLFVFVMSAAGCGGQSKVDALFKKDIDLLNKIADAMEEEAPLQEITKLQTESMELSNKIGDLNFSPAQRKRLVKRYGDRRDKAYARVQMAKDKHNVRLEREREARLKKMRGGQ